MEQLLKIRIEDDGSPPPRTPAAPPPGQPAATGQPAASPVQASAPPTPQVASPPPEPTPPTPTPVPTPPPPQLTLPQPATVQYQPGLPPGGVPTLSQPQAAGGSWSAVAAGAGRAMATAGSPTTAF